MCRRRDVTQGSWGAGLPRTAGSTQCSDALRLRNGLTSRNGDRRDRPGRQVRGSARCMRHESSKTERLHRPAGGKRAGLYSRISGPSTNPKSLFEGMPCTAPPAPFLPEGMRRHQVPLPPGCRHHQTPSRFASSFDSTRKFRPRRSRNRGLRRGGRRYLPRAGRPAGRTPSGARACPVAVGDRRPRAAPRRHRAALGADDRRCFPPGDGKECVWTRTRGCAQANPASPATSPYRADRASGNHAFGGRRPHIG